MAPVRKLLWFHKGSLVASFEEEYGFTNEFGWLCSGRPVVPLRELLWCQGSLVAPVEKQIERRQGYVRPHVREDRAVETSRVEASTVETSGV